MKKHIAITALLIATLTSCTNKNTMTIEPIDKELNNQLLTGERLDPNFFSRTDLWQYYQVTDTDGLTPDDVQAKLDTFVSQQYGLSQINQAGTFTVYFYQKKATVDYSNNLYESLRDSENGTIPDQNENLLDIITFKKSGIQDKLLRNRILYKGDNPVLDLNDSVNVNND